jgi:hypothetical protein
MEHTERPAQAFTYVLVTVEGQLSVQSGTFQEMRESTFGGHRGANEIIDLPALYPVAAYCSIAYDRPDPRRMNKVANGMVWELTARPDRGLVDPERDDVLEAYAEDALRVVKMRGPVVFFERIRSLAEEEVATLRKAHETAYSRLNARGWI